MNTSMGRDSPPRMVRDVDGGGYPGGFGVPHTSYYDADRGSELPPDQVCRVPS